MDLSHVAPEHREVLQRLHARVEEAVHALEQLRAENERLRDRVAELESRPAVPDDKTLLLMDDDRAALRERIAGFIDAIDRYLDDVPDADASDADAPALDVSAPDGNTFGADGLDADRAEARETMSRETTSRDEASPEDVSREETSRGMNGTAPVSRS